MVGKSLCVRSSRYCRERQDSENGIFRGIGLFSYVIVLNHTRFGVSSKCIYVLYAAVCVYVLAECTGKSIEIGLERVYVGRKRQVGVRGEEN